MRIGICGDIHWSKYSSIVRSRGTKYSTRLEKLIETINWFELTCYNNNCDCIIYLGDFFDACDVDSESITALQEIKWSHQQHYFITGNHEMGRSNLEFSSAHLFNLCPNTNTIDTVCNIKDVINDTDIIFLPYILELDRKPLEEYLKPFKAQNTIVMSHNDISGIQMGAYLSKDGFSIEEIEENCSLFINGHLHNGAEIGKNIINLGNLTGQNFSEDAYKYKHQCMILDTDTHNIDFIENPYAMNFFKLDFTKYQNNEECKDRMFNILHELNNAVITVKCNTEILDFVRETINNSPYIIESRIILDLSNQSSVEEISNNEDLSINHINKFAEYIKKEVGVSELILDELEHVIGASV